MIVYSQEKMSKRKKEKENESEPSEQLWIGFGVAFLFTSSHRYTGAGQRKRGLPSFSWNIYLPLTLNSKKEYYSLNAWYECFQIFRHCGKSHIPLKLVSSGISQFASEGPEENFLVNALINFVDLILSMIIIW